MLENILLAIFLQLVKAGEYFIGYCLAISESWRIFGCLLSCICESWRIFCWLFLAISECWRIFCWLLSCH